MNQVTIKKDAARDVITADIVWKGRYGVAQIRAVAPMGPLRQALQSQLAARGVRRSQMSGTTVLGCKCEKLVTKMAGVHLARTIATAARTPFAKMAKDQARMAAKVARFVQLAESGALEEQFGGWEGLDEHLENRRLICARAWKARGIPAETIRACMARMAREDQAAIQKAASIAEESDEESDDESSGFSLRKFGSSLVRASTKLSPSHYLRKALTRKARAALRRGGGGGGGEGGGGGGEGDGGEGGGGGGGGEGEGEGEGEGGGEATDATQPQE